MSHHDWNQQGHPDDLIGFHLDLGCGRLKKALIGIDRYPDEGVDIVMDLDDVNIRLPFEDSSIGSIVSHHCMEHIGEGFIPLMDEIYRVLEDGGILRAIVPLFPSKAAVEDADHCRYFMEGTFDAFCGDLDNCWLEGFSTPYTKARFEKGQVICTPLAEGQDVWDSIRELRVTLKARK